MNVRLEYRDNRYSPWALRWHGTVLYRDAGVILVRKENQCLCFDPRTGEDDRAQLWRIHPDDLAAAQSLPAYHEGARARTKGHERGTSYKGRDGEAWLAGWDAAAPPPPAAPAVEHYPADDKIQGWAAAIEHVTRERDILRREVDTLKRELADADREHDGQIAELKARHREVLAERDAQIAAMRRGKP